MSHLRVSSARLLTRVSGASFRQVCHGHKHPVAVTTPDGHTQNVGLPHSISPTKETVLQLSLAQNNHYVSLNKSHISTSTTGELTEVSAIHITIYNAGNGLSNTGSVMSRGMLYTWHITDPVLHITSHFLHSGSTPKTSYYYFIGENGAWVAVRARVVEVISCYLLNLWASFLFLVISTVTWLIVFVLFTAWHWLKVSYHSLICFWY